MKCRARACACRAVPTAIIVVGLALPAYIRAADTPAARPALSPQDSLQQIVVDPGLKVELAAHEPNVIDPVAIRFDEDGRMWVVEMRDYPLGPTKEFPARSRISILRDEDNDGFYETATVFADSLSFATGLQPWKGGVFVTLAGKVVYMKDTDGDDKVDVNETWYTGFAQVNQQLRANRPTFALDGDIYVAAGLRGGTITDPSHPEVKPVSISGMDFRFDPLTRKFEAVTGEAQFGLSFDDYGNRFVCANRDPAIHMVLENAHLKKNPLVTVDTVLEHVVYGDHKTPIYPIGRAWTTSNLHAGQFTAACGLEIYRGDALPSKYYGNVFVCEPTGYLVHREVIKPSGVTFAETQTTAPPEFFASRDEWCRPVNLEVGPDGALYIVDMYRQIIEHPEWMPEELRKRPNLRAGNDRGRIYRVVPQDFKRPPMPKMSAMSSAELVDALASGNAWRRETAARLLLERQDNTVAPQLIRAVVDQKSQVAVVHALRLLDQLSSLDEDTITKVFMSDDARIVEQAIQIAEPRLAKSQRLQDQVSDLRRHPDARVRFQAVLALGPLRPPLAIPRDVWERDAALIAAGNAGGDVLKSVLRRWRKLAEHGDEGVLYVNGLARLAAASPDKSQATTAIKALTESSNDFQWLGLTAVFTEASRRGTPLDTLKASLGDSARQQLDRVMDDVAAVAAATDSQTTVRRDAVNLLAFADNASKVLLPIALDDADQSVRQAAINALAKSSDTEPWRKLLAKFTKESPAIQRAILDGVLGDTERTALLLDSIAEGNIKPAVIDPVRAKLVLKHKDATIRQRATKLLASAIPADREKALADYQPALALKSDAARGRAIFEKRCSTCHQINGIGTQLAPDISDSRERTPLQLLTDILQPNRAIDSNYFSYTAVTTDGRVHTGLLSAETSTSVTFKQQEGKSETLRRDEIDDLNSDGVSFMPEGLEKDIPPQDMADLISFIKNWRYLENPQEFTPAGK